MRKGKGIRSEKRQGHSRFPAGQKHMATLGKTTDRMPEATEDIDQRKRHRKRGRVRKNIEEKEEKREEDKIGKETRALQVPCGSETSGYSGENNR